ncbi:MAG: hypothetical protein N3D73_02120 [Candidatus Diapherotrites archaeon]|nr:hypothetical protein [Candidatus Diapherotrites archaeon]
MKEQNIRDKDNIANKGKQGLTRDQERVYDFETADAHLYNQYVTFKKPTKVISSNVLLHHSSKEAIIDTLTKMAESGQNVSLDRITFNRERKKDGTIVENIFVDNKPLDIFLKEAQRESKGINRIPEQSVTNLLCCLSRFCQDYGYLYALERIFKYSDYLLIKALEEGGITHSKILQERENRKKVISHFTEKFWRGDI